MRFILNRVLLAFILDFHSRCSRCANASQEARLLTEAAEMPLDEMRLMLEQWGNITGEPARRRLHRSARFMASGPMLR
jgi:hypothetical protein